MKSTKNIKILLGDITKIQADAIVNAAGKGFGSIVGGGVDLAIFKAGGNELREEAKREKEEKCPNGLQIGQAVITKAHNLSCKYVIHTLGPRYYSEDINKLKDCYVNSLKLAEENDCKSIAFPAISTGAYGCTIEKSAEIVKSVMQEYKSGKIEEFIFVLYSEKDYEVYKKVFKVLDK